MKNLIAIGKNLFHISDRDFCQLQERYTEYLEMYATDKSSEDCLDWWDWLNEKVGLENLRSECEVEVASPAERFYLKYGTSYFMISSEAKKELETRWEVERLECEDGSLIGFTDWLDICLDEETLIDIGAVKLPPSEQELRQKKIEKLILGGTNA